MKKKSNHKYLLFLYSRVDDFLSNDSIVKDDLPDTVVSFCIVAEKVLKIKLHNKNPLLVFDPSFIKDDNLLSIIALKKEKDFETAKIKSILDRFEIVFKDIFTPDEIQALEDIYRVRNSFVHGYKSDDKIDFDQDDLVKKMGIVWEKISNIAVSLFGKENIKGGRPKKKYTESELEKVLEDEVRKMIQPVRDRLTSISLVSPSVVRASDFPFNAPFQELGKQCPRCNTFSFYFGGVKNNNPWAVLNGLEADNLLFGGGGLNLYKCKYCNLELTEKQYEIARKLNGSLI